MSGKCFTCRGPQAQQVLLRTAFLGTCPVDRTSQEFHSKAELCSPSLVLPAETVCPGIPASSSLTQTLWTMELGVTGRDLGVPGPVCPGTSLLHPPPWTMGSPQVPHLMGC